VAADEKEGRVLANVTFKFIEMGENDWVSVLEPEIITDDLREVYKLSLICAVLQQTCKEKMTFMDQYIKTKQEIIKIHNELVSEKTGKPIPDTEKYQKKLPFEEDMDI